ncbi:YutD family protein [Paenibacillus sp. NPDC057967]|uniref:YutD family protein n=1 Tax=Paenibacillus sp. NPDC057967 TaxID=3346293 RepID=UPI0036DA4E97
MALIHIGGKSYELIHENRSGWNPEAFRNRYSEVLERYDYIIGDWGYNQLRLKGFFRDGHQKANKESTYATAADYINEYCNFGCAYFILEKKQGARREPSEEDMDLDLEYGEDAVRLEAGDLRAAVESAAVSASAETASAAEAPKAAPREQHPHRHRGGSGNPRAEGGNRSSGGDGQSRRKDFRNKNHRGNHDHKGKKPVKAAASESAAASEQSRNANPSNQNQTNKDKDAGRS